MDFVVAGIGRVLIVLDDKSGHQSKSKGVITALQRRMDFEVCAWSPSSWSFAIGKILRRTVPQLCPMLVPSRFESVDLVVGSGGNTLAHTFGAMKSLNAKGLFVGSTRGLEKYNLQSVHADPMRDYGHFFPVLPPKFDINSLSEAWLSFASEEGIPSEEAFDVLFFGGDGSGCTWRPADLHSILELIKSSFDQTGRRWLISTSRRTPLWLEQELRRNIPEAAVADACWFGQGDQRRVVQPYLGAASRVFVSMDSATMMHEALFSGRPVSIVGDLNQIASRPHRASVDGLVQAGLLAQDPLDPEKYLEDFADQMLRTMGLSGSGS
ncbi:MAG: ELM1/GtrOC1 family putative glycosyltransferase [Planctomycetota bacterium]|nr:ELM1/GtrOC1 family putative glycosyltransferase [Planctomycetota bacterium]